MLILLEIQTTGETSVLTPAKQYTNEADALQEFYTVCSYAVKSTVEIHTVMILEPDGKIYAQKTFKH